MSKLAPYVRFNDKKCREAMTFYQSCFGGKLEFMTVGESPMKDADMPADMPKNIGDNIMHASLINGEFELFGADMMRDKAKIGDNVVVSVNFKDVNETKEAFKKLSAGGEVFMELDKTFWAELFGVVTDKYGVEWMFNCSK